MADYAPVYMDTYDQDQSEVPVLVTLTLSANTVADDAVAGTVIGAITGKTSAGVLSTPYEVGNFAISGTNLVIGASGPVAAGTYTVYVVENNPKAASNPRTTPFTITVTETP